MPSLRPWLVYAGRRWRTTALVLVALVATAVYGIVADRGHDPEWTHEATDTRAVLLDADALYTVDGNGLLVARDRSGEPRWNLSLGPGEAYVDTGNAWVGVATGGSAPRLRVLRATDGSALLDASLPAQPRALDAEGETLAVALEGAEGRVQVWDRTRLLREVVLDEPARAVAVRDGTFAAGGALGRVLLARANATLVEYRTDLAVRSLGLTDGATRLVVGGMSARQGDLSGGVAVYDLDPPRPSAGPRWRSVTESGIGVVDVSDDGSVVLALEEGPTASVVRVTPGDGGDTWRHVADGIVARQGTTGWTGVALAPDGAHVAYATLRGGVHFLDAREERTAWTWRAKGATSVAFSADEPGAFVANARLRPSGGYDLVALFDARTEPFLKDASRLLPAVAAFEVVLGALVLAAGRVRELRA